MEAYNMYRLLENKNHLIDKLNLTSEQKEEIKAFFLKHPSYESKIDWNNKSLQYKDFEPLLALDGKSKTQAKKYGLVGLVEGKDYVDFGETDIPELGSCLLYQPLTYLGSKTLASNAVAPIKGNGAKWCIAYQKTDEYWSNYTKQGIKFLFVFTPYTKYALTIYPESLYYGNEVYSFMDKNLNWPNWCNNSYILKCIENLREIPRLSLEELLRKYKNILIRNPDGTIDKVAEGSIDLFDFIKDGHFLYQFNKWEGDFNCRKFNLTSLKGAPKIVKGYFDCRDNNLTSLEGAPEIVEGRFDCGYNNLTSLKKAPQKVGSFYCECNQLTSLEGCPKKLKTFECSSNQLTSLKEGPEEVTGNYACNHNKLISLIGAPKKIGGSFYCCRNQLSSFEGGPEYIEGLIMCYNNSKLGTISSTKGIPSYIGKYMLCSLRFKRALERIGAPFEIRVY